MPCGRRPVELSHRHFVVSYCILPLPSPMALHQPLLYALYIRTGILLHFVTRCLHFLDQFIMPPMPCFTFALLQLLPLCCKWLVATGTLTLLCFHLYSCCFTLACALELCFALASVVQWQMANGTLASYWYFTLILELWPCSYLHSC